MKTILVVDDDKMILRLAIEALRYYGEGYNIKTALNGNQAVQVLNASGADLVLTDLKMPGMDGYELLSYMNEHHRNIPVIVMTGFGSPDIAKRLKQKGVLHYIEKPFEISVLREKISAVFESSSKGYIHGFTLANFLQAVEVEQKTTTLRVRSKGKIGYMHVREGELIDAETENIKGEAAALEILCWDDAKIEILEIHKRDRTINSSLMQILLEASKKKDDYIEMPLPREELLEQVIQLAEGHHFKDAHKILTEFLKDADNRCNPRGWLWYSRIIVSMKSIETALNNAMKLAPNDIEIAEDLKKFNFAINQIGAKEQIRRCPFCWSPIETKAFQCPYCRSHLLIHSQLFKSPLEADRQILEKAIERYTKVIGRETSVNINAYYYLSMAHLNLRHWEESLTLFHKTVNHAPDKKVFSDQLRALLNYMASRESAYEQQEVFRKKIETEADEKLTSTKKKRILVVEDSPTTRKVIAITLGQKGYEIIEARDGIEALSMLNEGKPDLVLLDIILPKMDGYKILEIIRKNSEFRDIPVIMLTSRDGMLSKLKGRLAGSTAYLTKPFEPGKLVETIEKYL